MKKLILTILLCLIAVPSRAEKCYVYIDKIGVVHKGEKASQNEYGDVIGIYPFTSQYKPTKAERDRYKIIVINLTNEESNSLLQPDYKEGTENLTREIIRARKRKFDLDNEELKSLKQEGEVINAQKSAILDAVIIKPTLRK